ncbi:MAG: murein L,D-transpeptidase family protein [Armatimonadota bacterium]
MRRCGKLALLVALLLAAALLLARNTYPIRAVIPMDRSKLPASSLPDRSPIPGDRVVVIHKAERVLGLYLDGRLATAYPIGLGRHPEGTKERRGDGRTPEGQYSICTRNARSRFHLFLGISYPNEQDADRAAAQNRITTGQHRAIIEATAAGSRPPWDTPLGGEIGIHGGGSATDWTLGCIALDDDAVDHLWDNLRIGDPVLIEP